MALRAVLMLWHRDTGAGGLANIQWRAVTAEDFHRRPFGQHRNGGWSERSKILGRMNDPAPNNGKHGFDALDFLLGNGEVIVGERDEVSQLTDGDCAFLSVFVGKPTAALRVEPQRFFARKTILVGIHRCAADGSSSGEPVKGYPGIVARDPRGICSCADWNAQL